MSTVLRINVPLAPRLSDCFVNASGPGRVKSEYYKGWCHWAGTDIMSQRPQWLISGFTFPMKSPLKVTIILPVRKGRDLDNRFKASLDILKDMGIIEDDSWPIVAELAGLFDSNLPKDRQTIIVETL